MIRERSAHCGRGETKQTGGVDLMTFCRGWFLNPYRPAIERPRNVIAAAMMRPFVRRAIHQLTARP